MKTGCDLAECALLPKWDKFTYSQMDCQAFVEAVIKDIGIRKPDGSVYDWKGSNSMYRNFYTWHGTIEDCIKEYGHLPLGAFVYIWKETGEPETYKDKLGNFSHVGIYCGNDIVRDSTRSTKTGRNGVGTRSLSGFTYCSLFSGIDYSVTNSYNASIEGIMAKIDLIHNTLIELEGTLNELVRSKGLT